MADTTTAAPAPKGGGKKIMGMDRTLVIGGGIALVAGLLYYVWKSRSATGKGTGTGQGKQGIQVYTSPTGLTNQQLLNWYKQHSTAPKPAKKKAPPKTPPKTKRRR